MYKKIIIANWKANPTTLADAQELFNAEIEAAKKYPNVKTVVCPPFVFLEELSKISREHLGAQDIFWENPTMFKNFGVSHVLVGHSDRRKAGDTDKIINQKLKLALQPGVTPILLVGERNRGDDRRAVLEEQLLNDLANFPTPDVRKLLICYEPVWAISTNPNAEADPEPSPRGSYGASTPENTLEAIKIINNFLAISYKLSATSCLYGGSVSEKNVADFLSHPEIGGAVIGGASLRKEEFAKILEIASSLT